MKLFTVVAWVSGILSVILMILGAISLLLGNNLLGVRHEANFYTVASSLLLLSILCVLSRLGCEKKL